MDDNSTAIVVRMIGDLTRNIEMARSQYVLRNTRLRTTRASVDAP